MARSATVASVRTCRDGGDATEIADRLDVDAVVAHAASRDDLQLGQLGEQLSRDARMTHDPACRISQPLHQRVVRHVCIGLAWRQVRDDGVTAMRAQERDALVIEESLRHDHLVLHAEHPSLCHRARLAALGFETRVSALSWPVPAPLACTTSADRHMRPYSVTCVSCACAALARIATASPIRVKRGFNATSGSVRM